MIGILHIPPLWQPVSGKGWLSLQQAGSGNFNEAAAYQAQQQQGMGGAVPTAGTATHGVGKLHLGEVSPTRLTTHPLVHLRHCHTL